MRSVSIRSATLAVRRGAQGIVYLRSRHPLGAYPVSLTERLEYWADRAADRAFLARRDPSGRWRSLTYAETLGIVRRVSQALVARRLSSDRPLLILSGNSIEHALLALAAMHIGALYAPIAPAYSLQAREYGTLGQVFDRVNPALVFAAEGASYEAALRSVLPYLRTDADLRERFFSKLKVFFYAAAGLTQRVFDELQELAVATCGEELLWITGLGSTETAPFAMSTGRAGAWAGFVGFPVPGMDLKLVPVDRDVGQRWTAADQVHDACRRLRAGRGHCGPRS